MGLESGGVIAWGLVALPFALFATRFAAGRAYFPLIDVAIGLVGAALGGYAARWLPLDIQASWVTVLLASIVGAVLLTRLVRAAPGRAAA